MTEKLYAIKSESGILFRDPMDKFITVWKSFEKAEEISNHFRKNNALRNGVDFSKSVVIEFQGDEYSQTWSERLMEETISLVDLFNDDKNV